MGVSTAAPSEGRSVQKWEARQNRGSFSTLFGILSIVCASSLYCSGNVGQSIVLRGKAA